MLRQARGRKKARAAWLGLNPPKEEVEETETSIGTVMLQSKKICMVEDDFIIWNPSTTDMSPASLLFSVVYGPRLPERRRDEPLEPVLDWRAHGQHQNRRADLRFVNR